MKIMPISASHWTLFRTQRPQTNIVALFTYLVSILAFHNLKRYAFFYDVLTALYQKDKEIFN